MASISPTRIKVGDVIRLTENKFDRPRRWVGFRVVEKAPRRYRLDKMSGVKYRYSWDYKNGWWTAKELSSHYASVYRGGKKLGDITTKYW